jgi:hypothetical protein
MSDDEDSRKSDRHIPNHYRPSGATAILAFLAFMVMSFVSYNAVRVANKGQDAARNDAQLARIAAANAEERLGKLQEQLDCTLAITMKSLEGSLQNSIGQDDMLIASFEGGDRTQYVARLREVRARLQVLADEVSSTQKACTNS